jgi:hypothetical protein
MNKPADPIDAAIARDADALRAATERDLPSFFETTRALRGALLVRPGHPSAVRWAAWGWTAAAAGVGVVLAFVPVSYPALAGHDVALSVAGHLAPSSLAAVARGLRAGVDGEGVRVEADGAGTTFRTRVHERSTRNVREAASAFAAVLRGSGLEAQVSVSPWTVRESGSVYGFASDRLVQILIEVRGRSSAEIEGEIAARLEAIGFNASLVLVEHEGGRTDVAIRATGPDGRLLETETSRELSGPAAKVDPPIAIDMMEFADLDSLPPAERRDAIERRLRERGIHATVTLEDGKLRIEAVDERVRE